MAPLQLRGVRQTAGPVFLLSGRTGNWCVAGGCVFYWPLRLPGVYL